MEKKSRNRYFRNNNSRNNNKRTSYRSNTPNRSRYNYKRSCNISINQLISKAVCENVPSIYVPDHTFLEFELEKEIQKNIQKKKYTNPTKIQYEAIPHILKGKDILGSKHRIR